MYDVGSVWNVVVATGDMPYIDTGDVSMSNEPWLDEADDGDVYALWWPCEL